PVPTAAPARNMTAVKTKEWASGAYCDTEIVCNSWRQFRKFSVAKSHPRHKTAATARAQSQSLTPRHRNFEVRFSRTQPLSGARPACRHHNFRREHRRGCSGQTAKGSLPYQRHSAHAQTTAAAISNKTSSKLRRKSQRKSGCDMQLKLRRYMWCKLQRRGAYHYTAISSRLNSRLGALRPCKASRLSASKR